MEDIEIWKDIEEYKGLYQVSNLGRVRSIRNGKEKILKPFDNHGYLRVQLYKDGVRKKETVHRLVAKTFIPNPENKPYVDHINTIREDNKVENLRWVTHEENINNPLTNIKRKKSLTGRAISEEQKKKQSEKMKGRKLSIEHKKKISENNSNAKGVICNNVFFNSIQKCSDHYNIPQRVMAHWLDGTQKMPQRFIDLGLRYTTEEETKEYKISSYYGSII